MMYCKLNKYLWLILPAKWLNFTDMWGQFVNPPTPMREKKLLVKKFKSLHLVSFKKDICYNVKALNQRLKKGDN